MELLAGLALPERCNKPLGIELDLPLAHTQLSWLCPVY
jgi:hypothetical protein